MRSFMQNDQAGTGLRRAAPGTEAPSRKGRKASVKSAQISELEVQRKSQKTRWGGGLGFRGCLSSYKHLPGKHEDLRALKPM